MSDLPEENGGRKLPSQDYVARQPACCYVTMRDGMRLAVDVYRPLGHDGKLTAGKWPTIGIFTPYFRRFV